jgi:hypothetical protein
MTTRAIGSRQAGQGVDEACRSALAERAPQVGQNADPSNISAKQLGQLMVASRARQYEQRGAWGSAAAPQFGQCNPWASVIRGLDYP